MPIRRRALITGITGQDASYLAELLLEKDYEVFGTLRRKSLPEISRVQHIMDRIHFIPADLLDSVSLENAIKVSAPDEIYNLAAQSFVAHSFEAPLLTLDVTGTGAIRLFEAARKIAPKARIYQASSSEQFGNCTDEVQTLQTPFNPASPYGCAKVLAHQTAHVYRRAYKMYIVCGISFNHESPRRGEEFVTRKITRAVANIKAGKQTFLRLGNTEARRDWSHAKDVVRGAWMSLQQDEPDDYIFASGVTHSVEQFVDEAFSHVGLNASTFVLVDPAFMRPVDVAHLCGDNSWARMRLGWEPTITFEQLVHEMVEHDLKSIHTTG